MPDGPTAPERWFLIEYRTGARAANQPVEGFTTKGEAIAWHRDRMGGDMRYVFRSEAAEESRASAWRRARDPG